MLGKWRDTRTRNIKYLLLFHSTSGNANAPQFFFCYIWRSIPVHMHSVFCVLCNTCDNVQQYAGSANSRGICSALWDALSLIHVSRKSSEESSLQL